MSIYSHLSTTPIISNLKPDQLSKIPQNEATYHQMFQLYKILSQWTDMPSYIMTCKSAEMYQRGNAFSQLHVKEIHENGQEIRKMPIWFSKGIDQLHVSVQGVDLKKSSTFVIETGVPYIAIPQTQNRPQRIIGVGDLKANIEGLLKDYCFKALPSTIKALEKARRDLKVVKNMQRMLVNSAQSAIATQQQTEIEYQKVLASLQERENEERNFSAVSVSSQSPKPKLRKKKNKKKMQQQETDLADPLNTSTETQDQGASASSSAELPAPESQDAQTPAALNTELDQGTTALANVEPFVPKRNKKRKEKDWHLCLTRFLSIEPRSRVKLFWNLTRLGKTSKIPSDKLGILYIELVRTEIETDRVLFLTSIFQHMTEQARINPKRSIEFANFLLTKDHQAVEQIKEKLSPHIRNLSFNPETNQFRTR